MSRKSLSADPIGFSILRLRGAYANLEEALHSGDRSWVRDCKLSLFEALQKHRASIAAAKRKRPKGKPTMFGVTDREMLETLIDVAKSEEKAAAKFLAEVLTQFPARKSICL